jgi:hypothetical protein
MAAALAVVILPSASAAWFLQRDRSRVEAKAQAELLFISIAGTHLVERSISALDIVVSLAMEGFKTGQLDADGVRQWLLKQSSHGDSLVSLGFLAVANGI